ncbi:MAG: c-type cytochrome [Acidiferrobacteraceae bacterium]
MNKGWGWAIVVGVVWLAMIPGAQAAGNVAAGQQKAAECEGCHGPNGDSAVPTYPKLAGQDASYIEKQLNDFKSGKRTNAIMSGMAAGLSPTDIRNLAAFFSSQQMSPGSAQGSAKVIALGRKIYRGGDRQHHVPACMSCHGPAGAGIPPRFPRLGGQWAQYVQAQLLAFRSGKRANDPAGMMRTIAGRLTRPQIAAVSQYIAGLGERPAAH